MMSTVTTEGHVTLPRQIRDRLGLNSGDKVDFVLRDDGRVEMVPVKISIRELKGVIAPPVTGVTLEEMDEAVRAGAAVDDGN